MPAAPCELVFPDTEEVTGQCRRARPAGGRLRRLSSTAVVVRSLRVIHCQVIAARPSPDQIAGAIRYAVEELLTGPLPRVGCASTPLTPTEVKRKIMHDQLKRPQRRTRPQPTRPLLKPSASRPPADLAQAADAPDQMAVVLFA